MPHLTIPCRILAVLLLVLDPGVRSTAQSGRPPRLAPEKFRGLVLNEILASNTALNVDEDGDSLDWVEIHNPGSRAIALDGCFLSYDPGAPRAWSFPACSVPAGGYLLVWLSGKDRSIAPVSAIGGLPGSPVFEPTFIGLGERWRYRTGRDFENGLPSRWYAPGFKDGSFDVGPTGFGFGDNDDATVLPRNTVNVFIRKTFSVTNPARIHSLVLRVDYDDGFVAYLNGKEIAAANAPSGDLGAGSSAIVSHEAGTVENFEVSPGLLRGGKNVLAIAGLNSSAGSTDMTLRPELGTVRQILHANFKIKKSGDHLLLSSPAGVLIDEVEIPRQTTNHSYGRCRADGSWCFFLTPTPGAKNHPVCHAETSSFRVTIEPQKAWHTHPVAINMTAKNARDGLNIRYTIDGSVPTTSSSRYWKPLKIRANTVFRAAAFVGEERASRMTSRSYFFGRKFDLPMVSISMDPADYRLVHNTVGGRGRQFERPAFMEIIDGSGKAITRAGCGLRLHGGVGRKGDFEKKKSYRLCFRATHGTRKLKHDLFGGSAKEDSDQLVLRAGLDDCFLSSSFRHVATYLRDELIRELHRDMGALAPRGTWCLLSVNTRVRGIYNIVERVDANFLDVRLGGKDWDVIKFRDDPTDGTIDEWKRLLELASAGGLANNASFKRFAGEIDVENFTDYMIVNMWAQNFDWPDNNWYAYRRREVGEKWRFMCWDAEYGLGLEPRGFQYDALRFVLSRRGSITDIFAALWENTGYRGYFLGRVKRHLGGSIGKSNVLGHIQRLSRQIAKDIELESRLYGIPVKQWKENVKEMRVFAMRRGPVFLQDVQQAVDRR